ncbi:hypothetical protein MTO96_022202 [Rhipicephalus appendiculatus]
MYPNAGLCHPYGYPYYGQQMYAYGNAPDPTATGAVADPFSYLTPFVPFQMSAATDGHGSAAFRPGDGVGVRTDRYSRLDRLAYALTILSVCTIAGLLVSAALVGRHMLILGEWTEPNTNAPMGLMDMEFRRSQRTPINDTAAGAESSSTQPILQKMGPVPSGNPRVGVDIHEATNAAMVPDAQNDAGSGETTADPTPVTHPKKRKSPTVPNKSKKPQSNNYGISRCGRAEFVYCENDSHAFYHVAGASGGACISNKRAHLNICNKSPNGFGSLSDCEQFCVNRNHPQKRCGSPAAFTTCSRIDMKRHWWYHDGLSCRQWEYPSGTCPTAESDTYETFQECYNKCAHRADRFLRCREPSAAACDVVHIRHPFFAVSSGDGTFRCLEASPDNLRGHICLTGGNNFQSSEACQQACLNKPRQRPSRSAAAKCKTGPVPAAAAAAPAPPRSSAGNLASVLVLFTVSIVTAGFVACAVATGRYIASGGVYTGMRGRYGDGESNVGPSMDLQGSPAAPPDAVPPANDEEQEAEKLARRFMIQPVEEASPDAVSEAGPATEPFKDIAAAAEGREAMPVAGRKRAVRTSHRPAREAKMQGWTPPPVVNNNTDTSDPPAGKNASVTSDDQRWNLTLH